MADDLASALIPRRHGVDLLAAQRMAKPLRLLIRSDPTPSSTQWQAMGMALLDGDAPMDALVAWMAETGMAYAKPLFDVALEHGIGAVANAPPALRQFFAEVDTLPDWTDPTLMADGARCCGISGLTGLRALRDVGLMAGYQASAINHTLVLTGALQRGPQRRLAETTKWWIDVTRPGAMTRFGKGYQTTLQVRLIHALVRKRLLALPTWDSGYYGLPINQFDLQATYLSFSVSFLFGQRLLGVPLRDSEAAAVMHLWKVIGWLMGIQPRWLVDTEQQGRIALYQNLLAQAPPDDSSQQLGRALMNEPLQRHYRHFATLRGHYERARHLSIERAFLASEGMRALGLPAGVMPWYPLLSFLPRLLWHGVHRVLPGGRQRLIKRGLAQQANCLGVLFGRALPEIIRNP